MTVRSIHADSLSAAATGVERQSRERRTGYWCTVTVTPGWDPRPSRARRLLKACCLQFLIDPFAFWTVDRTRRASTLRSSAMNRQPCDHIIGLPRFAAGSEIEDDREGEIYERLSALRGALGRRPPGPQRGTARFRSVPFRPRAGAGRHFARAGGDFVRAAGRERAGRTFRSLRRERARLRRPAGARRRLDRDLCRGIACMIPVRRIPIAEAEARLRS